MPPTSTDNFLRTSHKSFSNAKKASIEKLCLVYHGHHLLINLINYTSFPRFTIHKEVKC